MAAAKRKFKIRGFVSLISFWTFIILAFSGVGLFISPAGRIANWSGWTFLNLTKVGWGGLHTIIALIFLITAIFHIYLNWKPFMNYLRDKAKSSFNMRKELIASLVVTLVLFFGSVYQAQPLWQLMEWNTDIKNYWETESKNPPVPHAEEMTLAGLSKIIKVESTSLLQKLKENNIEIPSPDAKLITIANANNLKPNQIFAFFDIQSSDVTIGSGSEDGAATHAGAGKGLGKLTFGQYLEKENVDYDAAMTAIRKEIVSFAKEDNIKTIADKLNITPYALVNILENCK